MFSFRFDTLLNSSSNFFASFLTHFSSNYKNLKDNIEKCIRTNNFVLKYINKFRQQKKFKKRNDVIYATSNHLLYFVSAFFVSHMDEFIDNLLHEERYCDVIFPRIQVGAKNLCFHRFKPI